MTLGRTLKQHRLQTKSTDVVQTKIGRFWFCDFIVKTQCLRTKYNRPIYIVKLRAKSADFVLKTKSADFVFKAKSADFVLKTKSARAAPFSASSGLVGSRLSSGRRPARPWRAGLAKLGSRWRGLGRFPGVGSIGRGQAALEEGGEGALRLCA